MASTSYMGFSVSSAAAYTFYIYELVYVPVL